MDLNEDCWRIVLSHSTLEDLTKLRCVCQSVHKSLSSRMVSLNLTVVELKSVEIETESHFLSEQHVFLRVNGEMVADFFFASRHQGLYLHSLLFYLNCQCIHKCIRYQSLSFTEEDIKFSHSGSIMEFARRNYGVEKQEFMKRLNSFLRV